MITMWEPRHAAVVARAGCVPPLVALARDGAHPGNREFAAAMLASLTRSKDIQVEVVSAGGIPALIRCVCVRVCVCVCCACVRENDGGRACGCVWLCVFVRVRKIEG
jgi:hypothetical protein